MGTTENLTEEHFVLIEEYDHYEVSNFGTVINTKSGRELKTSFNGAGGLRVRLYKNGKAREHQVANLVAAAFFVDYTPDKVVNFINNDPSECTVMNLTLQPMTKASTRRIRAIKGDDILVFDSLTEAARILGGSLKLISRAAQGKEDTKTHRGYRFEYVD